MRLVKKMNLLTIEVTNPNSKCLLTKATEISVAFSFIKKGWIQNVSTPSIIHVNSLPDPAMSILYPKCD